MFFLCVCILMHRASHTDTTYVVHGDYLVHYDDSHVSQVSMDTIESSYIQVCS